MLGHEVAVTYDKGLTDDQMKAASDKLVAAVNVINHHAKELTPVSIPFPTAASSPSVGRNGGFRRSPLQGSAGKQSVNPGRWPGRAGLS
jgi:hypothetical protein